MAGNGTCYDPQHRPGLDSDNYQACWSGTSDGFSACCPRGWTCMKNLLCVYTGKSQNHLTQGTVQRGLCTDETFKSSNCPQFCLDGDKQFANGTTIKNCGDGAGCCITDKDCKCSAGSSGAILLEVKSVVPYTAKLSTPATVWISGTSVSVSTPISIAKDIASSANTIIASTSTTSTSVSTAVTKTESTTRNTILSTPTNRNLIATSTVIPEQMTASSSPLPSGNNSGSTRNVGLLVGVPVGIAVAAALLIIGFLLFRRRQWKKKTTQHIAETVNNRQWPTYREEQKWDYKTIPLPKYSPKPGFPGRDKPLPKPAIQAPGRKSSTPWALHELPSGDWLAKELPGNPYSPESPRYELG